ncbi:MAG: hypothetical protein QOG10_2496 [Kribbellaceae bacterium]|nr:hypothetical protein [Kribbellaceae bacterium]
MSTYVYAIAGAGHPLRLDGVGGVGEPAREIRVLRAGLLGVVASDAPEGLRAKRRDVLAHQRVLDRLLEDGTVLPMRFGLVAADDEQVVAAIAGGSEGYTERLAEIEGCREYNLKVTRSEDDLLRQVMEEVPEARRLNDLTRTQPDDHAQKMVLGEILAGEVRMRQDHGAREILASLAPRAVRHSEGEPTGSCFLNTSFLVSRDQAPAFAQAVHEEVERHDDSYSFKLNGPLPPYSFV